MVYLSARQGAADMAFAAGVMTGQATGAVQAPPGDDIAG